MSHAHGPNSTTASFAEQLRAGQAVGYVIAATPRRYSGLPSDFAATFAEISEENCGHIFATRSDARRQLARIPDRDRLGWIHAVRRVSFFGDREPPHGPRLDVRGHPFALHILVVDAAGQVQSWPYGGRFGWIHPPQIEPPTSNTEDSPPPFAPRVRRFIR